MYSKCDIYNLALGELLLTKQVINPDADTGVEVRVLNNFWKIALESTMIDLDLDSIAIKNQALTLFQKCPLGQVWKYAYNYPTNCILLRRLKHSHIQLDVNGNPVNVSPDDYYYWKTHPNQDTEDSQVPREVANYQGLKVIFTNLHNANIEYVPNDFSLNMLTSQSALCVATKLAMLSGPLIAGKGAGPLRKELQEKYVVRRAEAMEADRQENANFVPPHIQSAFVRARLS